VTARRPADGATHTRVAGFQPGAVLAPLDEQVNGLIGIKAALFGLFGQAGRERPRQAGAPVARCRRLGHGLGVQEENDRRLYGRHFP
jgi:hypothetical protein